MTRLPNAIEQQVRRAAMDALEEGMRHGCNYLADLCIATVSQAGAIPMQGPGGRGTASPFKYRRRTRHGGRWETHPAEWEGAAKLRDIPPLSRSGRGAASIGYMKVSRDDAAGVIVFMVGGDAAGDGTQGGFRTLPGYMTGHEYGIRYPTIGPLKGSGPVIQRPWLRSTVTRYWGSFTSIVTQIAGAAASVSSS